MSVDRVEELADLDQVAALTHPLRVRMLELLREPRSAADLARDLDEGRQNVNYHLKLLERNRLVRHVADRRKGNMVERQFEAVARSFVVSPSIALGDGRRAARLRDQVSLAALIGLGRQLQKDAAALLDAATFDGLDVASASVTAEVAFPDETARAAFMDEYLAALGTLLAKYGSKQGDGYRALLAVYPNITMEDSDG